MTELSVAVKCAVDGDPARHLGRIVLAGLSNLLMMEQIGETLAGRAIDVTLRPFTTRER